MIFKRLLEKILFLFGIKSFRWKLAICEIKNKKVKIQTIFNPGFFEFWADPFFIKHKNKKYIFFECFNYFSKKGSIQCIELKDNKIIDKKTILKKDYHLSYPHIFIYKKKYYLIPESYEKNETDIYKSIKLPHRWKKINTIFKGEKVCDTTIIYKNKKFWLFTNKSKTDLSEFNKKLYIYRCDKINFKNLKSVKSNPVINKFYSSRNAGSIYKKNKLFFRPAQVNRKNIYGYGFTLNKIINLDLNKYKQVQIFKVTPKSFRNKNICGVHHCDRIEGNTFIIDLCFRFSF